MNNTTYLIYLIPDIIAWIKKAHSNFMPFIHMWHEQRGRAAFSLIRLLWSIIKTTLRLNKKKSLLLIFGSIVNYVIWLNEDFQEIKKR